jgi:hypothetical protein
MVDSFRTISNSDVGHVTARSTRLHVGAIDLGIASCFWESFLSCWIRRRLIAAVSG